MSFDVFAEGEMVIEGRMPWSSNATFLVELLDPENPKSETGSARIRGIYKPHKGERPLWDFPNGLYRREAAAYSLSSFLGWNVIPRTIVRDGLYGIGSVQAFVDADFEQHYFTMMEGRPELDDQLRVLAAFDLLANNADRKGGHVLVNDDRIWGIDNGLCFHDEPKLRTVMWDYAGDPVPKTLLGDVERLRDLDAATDPFTGLLSDDECAALIDRAKRLLRKPVFPHPTSNYAYPWPMV